MWRGRAVSVRVHALFLLMCLTACGGGGTGDPTMPPPGNPTVAVINLPGRDLLVPPPVEHLTLRGQPATVAGELGIGEVVRLGDAELVLALGDIDTASNLTSVRKLVHIQGGEILCEIFLEDGIPTVVQLYGGARITVEAVESRAGATFARLRYWSPVSGEMSVIPDVALGASGVVAQSRVFPQGNVKPTERDRTETFLWLLGFYEQHAEIFEAIAKTGGGFKARVALAFLNLIAFNLGDVTELPWWARYGFATAFCFVPFVGWTSCLGGFLFEIGQDLLDVAKAPPPFAREPLPDTFSFATGSMQYITWHYPPNIEVWRTTYDAEIKKISAMYRDGIKDGTKFIDDHQLNEVSFPRPDEGKAGAAGYVAARSYRSTDSRPGPAATCGIFASASAVLSGVYPAGYLEGGAGFMREYQGDISVYVGVNLNAIGACNVRWTGSLSLNWNALCGREGSLANVRYQQPGHWALPGNWGPLNAPATFSAGGKDFVVASAGAGGWIGTTDMQYGQSFDASAAYSAGIELKAVNDCKPIPKAEFSIVYSQNGDKVLRTLGYRDLSEDFDCRGVSQGHGDGNGIVATRLRFFLDAAGKILLTPDAALAIIDTGGTCYSQYTVMDNEGNIVVGELEPRRLR